MDFIMNGQGHGSVATTLLDNGFDVASLRPWVGENGRHYVSKNIKGKMQAVPLANANATLRRDEWKQIDDSVAMAARERLRVVADLRAQGLVLNIPNGMGKTMLESETMGDITGATISMDPARAGESDRPEFGLVNLPLPVIHKDFDYTARQIAVSRNNGTGIDVTTAQMAARKVAEEAEKLTLGITNSYSYGGGTIYGMVNFPDRLTKVLTDPETSGWTPKTLVREILEMRQASTDGFYFGPWVIYASPGWDLYLDEDYSDDKGDNTLRQRLLQLQGISGIRTADHLTGLQMVMVQMTSDVIRLVIGMDITTIQWETIGGMRIHYKVMAIIVPQLRAVDAANDNAGIIHGAVP